MNLSCEKGANSLKNIIFLKMLQRMDSLRDERFYPVSFFSSKKEDKKSGVHMNCLFPLHVIWFKDNFLSYPDGLPTSLHDWASDYTKPWNRGIPHALFTLHLYPGLLLDTALYPQVQFQHTSFWSCLQTHAHIRNYFKLFLLYCRPSSLAS